MVGDATSMRAAGTDRRRHDGRVDPHDLAGFDHHLLTGPDLGWRALHRVAGPHHAYGHAQRRFDALSSGAHAGPGSSHQDLGDDGPSAREAGEHGDRDLARILRSMGPEGGAHGTERRQDDHREAGVRRIAIAHGHAKGERAPRPQHERHARHVGDRAEEPDRRDQNAEEDARRVDRRERAHPGRGNRRWQRLGDLGLTGRRGRDGRKSGPDWLLADPVDRRPCCRNRRRLRCPLNVRDLRRAGRRDLLFLRKALG